MSNQSPHQRVLSFKEMRMTQHTTETIAAALHGLQYGRAFPPKDIAQQAKESGIVIVYGYSDDNMELDGAISDEFGCYSGGTAHVSAQGLLQDWESVLERGEKQEIKDWLERESKAREITAVWSPRDSEISWVYETDIPHKTFHLMVGDDIYCIGIVFALADL